MPLLSWHSSVQRHVSPKTVHLTFHTHPRITLTHHPRRTHTPPTRRITDTHTHTTQGSRSLTHTTQGSRSHTTQGSLTHTHTALVLTGAACLGRSSASLAGDTHTHDQ